MIQEYELEGIDWAKVNFQDNQECLDLFEKVFMTFGSFLSLIFHSRMLSLLNFFASDLLFLYLSTTQS